MWGLCFTNDLLPRLLILHSNKILFLIANVQKQSEASHAMKCAIPCCYFVKFAPNRQVDYVPHSEELATEVDCESNLYELLFCPFQ